MDVRVVPVEQVRAFFEAHPHPNVLEPLAHPESKRYLAVFDDGDVVATATLQRRALRIDQLGGVLVDPSLQGTGIGTVLMDAVRAEARRKNAWTIVCGVYRRPPDVTGYYRRHGFRTWIQYVPGGASRWPLGWFSRRAAKAVCVEAGPDPIRIMARRP